MARIIGAIAGLIALAVLAQPAFAARMALVVGNSDYQHTTPLETPRADAFAFADFLRSNDFEVTEVIDADRAKMAAALAEFVKKLQPADTALFYYAGHGLQADGENYLMGIDAKLQSEFDVAAESMPLSQIVSQLEKRARIAMVFIDACRDNPLADKLATTTRGVSVGLAPLYGTGEGTMIAFAAAPGRVALDGQTNSPFTKALIENLAAPETEVSTAFKRVMSDVREETGGKQSPQYTSTMSIDFYFNLGISVQTGVVLDPEPDEPKLSVAVPEPEPAKPEPEVAVLPPAQPTVAGPMSKETELDLAAARRIGTLRALQLFIQKHRSEVASSKALDAIAITVASNDYASDVNSALVESGLELSTDAKTAAQRMLTAAGYDVGTPDGEFGPTTRARIKSYQASIGEPETGYLTTQTLAALGLLGAMGEPSPVANNRAGTYNAKDLARLESDARLITAIQCLGPQSLNYGFFEGHVYLAVRGDGEYPSAQKETKRCGGHLAALTSKEENAFVFSLISHDASFFDVGFNANGGWAAGPVIGLAQSSKKKEPRGDWTWDTGEDFAFNAWGPGQPDNFNGNEDTAHFWVEVPRGATDALKYIKPTWNDSPDGGNGFVMEID